MLRSTIRRSLDSAGFLDEVRLLRALIAQGRRALTGPSQQRASALVQAWRLYSEQMWPQVRGRYGAVRIGRADWQARWDASPGWRVLLYAYRDFAGSFYRWAEAINRHTPFCARLVTFGAHEYGYADDIVLPRLRAGQRPEGLMRLIAEADLVHVKDEGGFVLGTNRLPADIFSASGKPRVFTAYGGYMRALSPRQDFRAHVLAHDAFVAMTPDLIYDWTSSPHFIPHAIDSEYFVSEWQDRPIVAHSPSTKARKGTADFVSAMQELATLGLSMDLIHGVDHATCIARKRNAGLFFDQAGRETGSGLGIDTVIGWYGNSALEAAVFGIPTIAHLGDFAFDGAMRAGRPLKDICPILNTARGARGVRDSIAAYFERSSAERAALSMATRSFVEDFHSYAACAAQLHQLYAKLIGEPSDLGTSLPSAPDVQASVTNVCT